ncbi:hypothetical protein [Streptomyces flaveolus]|uniref:hypothetical protein n=1 Tax=Streptomyces flaveolus TaxID=67297 RepID=UPI0033EE58CA
MAPTFRATLRVLTLMLPVTLLAGKAFAATGSFTYTPPPELHVLYDPAAVCHPTPAGSRVDNETNQPVALYPTRNCAGHPLARVPPGTTKHTPFEALLPIGFGSGTLVYYTRPHPQHLEDPPSGTCHNIAGDGPVYNQTSSTALLYRYPNCPGTHHHAVAPHHHTNASFASVRFVD